MTDRRRRQVQTRDHWHARFVQRLYAESPGMPYLDVNLTRLADPDRRFFPPLRLRRLPQPLQMPPAAKYWHSSSTCARRDRLYSVPTPFRRHLTRHKCHPTGIAARHSTYVRIAVNLYRLPCHPQVDILTRMRSALNVCLVFLRTSERCHLCGRTMLHSPNEQREICGANRFLEELDLVAHLMQMAPVQL